MSFRDEDKNVIIMHTDVRRAAGCLKNSYHVTALHNAGECDDCLRLVARAYMKLFGIQSHVDFGEV